MTIHVEAKGLAEVQLSLGDGNTAALILTNTKHKRSGYLIGPEGLGALLEALLPLAETWVDQPDMKVEGLFDRRQAMRATGVSIQRGRTPDEAALVVHMGKTFLTFLVSLDVMVKAAAGMVRMIDPNSGQSVN